MSNTNSGEASRDSLISADENRRMFDRIASCYDFTNRFLTFGLDTHWRNAAIKRLNPVSGGHYLDVGCGTGDMAIKIVKKAPGAKVTGIDPSEGMLEQGHRKLVSAGVEESVDLRVGDALDLEYPPDIFDGAITAFCIRNVTNRKRALQEIYRTIKPGGNLIILELTDPQGPIMRPLFRLYSNLVMPLFTKIFSSSSAYRYLTDSMAAFPEAETIRNTMMECGFSDLEHRRMTGGIVTLFQGKKPWDTIPSRS